MKLKGEICYIIYLTFSFVMIIHNHNSAFRVYIDRHTMSPLEYVVTRHRFAYAMKTPAGTPAAKEKMLLVCCVGLPRKSKMQSYEKRSIR